LEARVNRVNLFVVGDGLKRDVRNALIDEAAFDIRLAAQRPVLAGIGRRMGASSNSFRRPSAESASR
jgi:hypothetical protein